MKMCEWASNNSDLMLYINEGDRCKKDVVKVLGIIWKIKQDEICLANMKGDDSVGVLTKRTMLKKIAPVYDPLGLFVPVIIRFKIILQDLWKRHIGMMRFRKR